MIFLIGLAAVVVDVGHMMTARNALQNAADAAALAGASCLTRSSAPSGQDCTSTPSASLNWAMAKTKAELTIRLNQVDGVSLVDGTVTTGYKNMAGTPANLQATTLSPVGAYDKPAVWVQLRKAPGSNGGPLQTLMTNLYGASGLSMTVTAVAVILGCGPGMRRGSRAFCRGRPAGESSPAVMQWQILGAIRNRFTFSPNCQANTHACTKAGMCALIASTFAQGHWPQRDSS
eukprot:gene20084-39698_t